MNCSSPVPVALMQPQTMTLPPPCLTVGKTHLSLYSSPGCRHTRLTPSEPNKFILVRSQDMVPVINVLSLLVFSKLFAGLLCASSLEEASFWDDTHADQFDAVCGVWSEQWQADPPPLQPLQQCWQHSYIYFPNTTSGYDAEHVHSTFWSAIFREMPVTANSKILQVITYSYVTEEHKRTQRNNLEAWDCPVPSWGQCSSFRCETDSRWAPVIKQSQCSSYMSNKLHCMLSPVPSIHCVWCLHFTWWSNPSVLLSKKGSGAHISRYRPQQGWSGPNYQNRLYSPRQQGF